MLVDVHVTKGIIMVSLAIAKDGHYMTTVGELSIDELDELIEKAMATRRKYHGGGD